MSEALIVSLDEFAELCQVTPETMRAHLKELDRSGAAAPGWMIERGDRGRKYQIEALGGLAWWRDKRETEAAGDAERQGRLRQLRLDVVGDAADTPELLTLPGKARREEYAAAMEAVKYRKMLGQLVEKVDVQRELTGASVELRRALQRVAPEFAIAAGLSADQQRDLDGRIERALDTFVAQIEKPDAFAS